MKMFKLAAISLAFCLYATIALAQHGHAGGMGGGMGHSSTAASDHGNSNAGGNRSAHQASVSSVLSKNPAIGDKIVALTGDQKGAADACTGFKNLGQCVATAHVSKNLSGLNFYCMRLAMTGTPVPSGQNITCNLPSNFKGPVSLGKAIQTFDPKANSGSETKKANTETQQDMKGSGVKS